MSYRAEGSPYQREENLYVLYPFTSPWQRPKIKILLIETSNIHIRSLVGVREQLRSNYGMGMSTLRLGEPLKNHRYNNNNSNYTTESYRNEITYSR